jgi:hypothetical protein
VVAGDDFKELGRADAKHPYNQGEKKREWRHKSGLGYVKTHSVHKKCDAKEPCTTCVNKNRGSTCKYEGSRSRGDVPSNSPMPKPKDFLARSDSSEPGSSYPSPFDLFARSSAPLVPWSDGSVAQKTLGVTEWSPRSTGSSFTILPSINFLTIPRPLHTSLSLIPPERVQVSWVAGNDLDMALYVFVIRSLKFSSGLKAWTMVVA